jgi:hypothetical protein
MNSGLAALRRPGMTAVGTPAPGNRYLHDMEERMPNPKPNDDNAVLEEPAKGGTEPANKKPKPSGDSPKPHGDPLKDDLQDNKK